MQEITAVLDTELVKDPLGSAIMDKLRSCTGKATAPCSGIQFEVQTNPMKPCKSIVWRRCSVPEPGRAVEAEDAEDVPYVLLYFTVSHAERLRHTFCMSSLHGVGICISMLWLPQLNIKQYGTMSLVCCLLPGRWSIFVSRRFIACAKRGFVMLYCLSSMQLLAVSC